MKVHPFQSCGFRWVNLHPYSAGVDDSAFPLFLTKREWLVALDGVVDDPFFERDQNGQLTASAARHAFGKTQTTESLLELPEARRCRLTSG